MKLRHIKITWVIAAAIILASCSSNRTNSPRPVPVSAVTVHHARIPLSYDYMGVVTPIRSAQVQAQVGGLLIRHNFLEGSFVKIGDNLFDIDSQQYEAAIEQAQGKVSQSEAIYKESKSASDRAQKLLDSHVLSSSVAQQTFSKMAESKAALRQAKAALSVAKLNLSYTKVKAPISGIIGRQLISDGSLLAPGSSVLATITQLDPLYIDFSFSSQDLAEIKQTLAQQPKIKQNHLEVTLYHSNGEPYAEKGLVDFTAPTIDENTSTVSARAAVENKDNRLVPGAFIRLKLSGLYVDGIAIPEGALMQDSSGAYVYVLRKISLAKNAPPMLLAIRLNVKIAKQLYDRRWLVKIPTNNDAKSEQQLQSGDQILAAGHFTVQAAMSALAGKLPGVPVLVTNLDGKVLLDGKAAVVK